VTESQQLLLVIALIYLSDCLLWAHARAIAFVSTFGKKGRWKQPSSLLGNPNGGVIVAHPFPPLGRVFVCRPWPVSFSPAGAFSYVAQAVNSDERCEQPERCVRYEDIQSVRTRSKEVRINDVVFFRADSEPLAESIAGLTDKLRRLPLEERAATIDATLATAFDEKAAGRRVEAFEDACTRLRLFCNGLFIFIFLAGPSLVWFFGWTWCWAPLLLVLLSAAAVIATEYYQAHRMLYPNEPGNRRVQTAAMCLNPLGAIRARDALSRHLLALHHPLAAARVLCDDASFRDFARRALLDLHFPLRPVCRAASADANDIERWFRERLRETADAFVRRAGFDPVELIEADPPEEKSSRTYCPRCQRQYERAAGDCAICGWSLMEWCILPREA